jgi:hypothetical protein
MALAPKNLKPEYSNFTLRAWQSNESWTALAGNRSLTDLLARDYFWEKVKDRALEELKNLNAEGWEPIEPIGPQAIKLSRTHTVDFSIDPADIFLWIMTLAVALVVQLLLNRPRIYVTYRPVEIRIRLSRFKQHQHLTAA